jgi:hypothetical protein
MILNESFTAARFPAPHNLTGSRPMTGERDGVVNVDVTLTSMMNDLLYHGTAAIVIHITATALDRWLGPVMSPSIREAFIGHREIRIDVSGSRTVRSHWADHVSTECCLVD